MDMWNERIREYISLPLPTHKYLVLLQNTLRVFTFKSIRIRAGVWGWESMDYKQQSTSEERGEMDKKTMNDVNYCGH